VSDVGGFLAAILPSLLKLGRQLFASTGGDVVKARRNIQSRVDELRRGQEANDAEAKRRFRRAR
jgi:hypothetical protein